MKTECETCKRNVERENWVRGRWDREPNVARFQHAGLVCIAHRGPSGAWCGYVGVEESHPLCGKEYNDIKEHIEVHGGLTYADEESYWCIKSDDGKKRWWFGFDFSHGGDLTPAFLFLDEGGLGKFFSKDHYWIMDEAIKEVKDLAEQLSKIGGKNG